jgi:hypothetical protein
LKPVSLGFQITRFILRKTILGGHTLDIKWGKIGIWGRPKAYNVALRRNVWP